MILLINFAFNRTQFNYCRNLVIFIITLGILTLLQDAFNEDVPITYITTPNSTLFTIKYKEKDWMQIVKDYDSSFKLKVRLITNFLLNNYKILLIKCKLKNWCFKHIYHFISQPKYLNQRKKLGKWFEIYCIIFQKLIHTCIIFLCLKIYKLTIWVLDVHDSTTRYINIESLMFCSSFESLLIMNLKLDTLDLLITKKAVDKNSS